MNYQEFNNLDFKQRLMVIHNSALEIDSIFPWYGNLRIIKIYKLEDFFIELECDLNTKELTNIYTFKSLEYLEKYPHHFDKIKTKIHSILND
jgi:hypothetical protein